MQVHNHPSNIKSSSNAPSSSSQKQGHAKSIKKKKGTAANHSIGIHPHPPGSAAAASSSYKSDWNTWNRLTNGLFLRHLKDGSVYKKSMSGVGSLMKCKSVTPAVYFTPWIIQQHQLQMQMQTQKQEKQEDKNWRSSALYIRRELLLGKQEREKLGVGEFAQGMQEEEEKQETDTTQDVEKAHVEESVPVVVDVDTSLERKRALAAITILDPLQYKRFKLQHRREGKQIEKNLRRARGSSLESLARKHKNFMKAVLNHQFEFLKYHRHKKSNINRLNRALRDRLDKSLKKKETEANKTERARLTALRANDMKAYASLLEETKNERLKFLWSKTDTYMKKISSLLTDQRKKEEEEEEEENSRNHDYDKGGSSSSSNDELPLSMEEDTSGSYYSSAHLKMEEARQPSILIGGDLKEYQLSGLQWLLSLYNNRLNGILADEMGLGKTIQTIALLAYLMEVKENRGPFLVIVPLSTLSNWTNEFAKWCPAANVVTYKGNAVQRKGLYKEDIASGCFNVLLTTYEYIIRDKASLRKIQWEYAIVDEGHRMKNANSKFAIILGTQYTTKYRILLTGTPLQNNLPELWALLNFLLPTIFNSVDTFDEWFNRPFAQFRNSGAHGNQQQQQQQQQQHDQEEESTFLSNEERMLIIHRLHELLRPFMLRRVKSEVLDQLPDKVEKVLRCELSSWQKELYKQISTSVTNGDGGEVLIPAKRSLNNVVMQLRKVCNHPYLFSPEGYEINHDLIRSSGKVKLLDQILPKLKAAGHRVLMFTQMTAVMTILEDYFSFRGYSTLRLDGSTPADEREKRMYQFNAPDSPYFIFLLSTRAGGLGLNLATADTVIIFDSDWNPMQDLQAQDRAHRIGQKNDVRVFRLITNSPVEEKILSKATEKLNMSEIVVDAGKFDMSSVEQDTSEERQKVMEVLLTDFDTNAAAESASGSSGGMVDDTDSQQGGDCGSENNEGEVLNEMLCGNEADYNLYCEIDAKNACSGEAGRAGLFLDDADIPDWIRNPKKKGQPTKEQFDTEILPTGKRRRRIQSVNYDDGLTDHQFVTMIEKKADEAEAKAAGILSEDTHRKLTNICKTISALKEDGTKRLIAELFLERPCAKTYPDYYQIISDPIAINDILKKCKKKMYSNLAEFKEDWKKLFANARMYNEEGSWVVADADMIRTELEQKLEKQELIEDEKSVPVARMQSRNSTRKAAAKDTAKDTPSKNPQSISEEASISDVVGMDQRTSSGGRSRGRIRSGGAGSRGGAGSYRKKK